MVLKSADPDPSSTCSLPSTCRSAPTSESVVSQGWLPAAVGTYARTAARQLHRRSVPCADADRRTGQTTDLNGSAAGATSDVRVVGGHVLRLGAAHARPPTSHTGLPAAALRRRSPHAVAVFAAHAPASDWLMPKLRPLELSDSALEPHRAHGQRRRGASAQRWRGAHSVRPAGRPRSILLAFDTALVFPVFPLNK